MRYSAIHLLALLVSFALPVCQVLGDEGGAIEAGDLAPPLAVANLAGGVFNLENIVSRDSAQAVVVVFWGTFCPGCEKAPKILDRMVDELKGKPVRILLISCDQPTLDAGELLTRQKTLLFFEGLRKFLDRLGLKHHREAGSLFSLAWDRELALAKRYRLWDENVLTLPAVFLIDSNRKVKAVLRAKQDITEGKFREFLLTEIEHKRADE